MRIGAYQFAVTGDIDTNYNCIKKGIDLAKKNDVRILMFPECALTGYPPHCIKSSSHVDFDKTNRIYEELKEFASENKMYLVVGSITKEDSKIFNSAIVFRLDGRKEKYDKRALWGWDKDNFSKGEDTGIFEMDSLRVGIRICFEVRFPEFFRELYKYKTDLNLILFYDTAKKDDPDRLSMIRGHIQTRAVENVCPILSCNTASSYQTAPTILFGRSGNELAKIQEGEEGLIFYDLEDSPLNFGEEGRKEISDELLR